MAEKVVEPEAVDRKREKRLLWKLDLFLITWAWFAYLIKQIDTSNYKTAYASGMKEDLGLYGNELNYLDTCFRIGYAICLLPSQVFLSRYGPKYWLPSLELAWGVATGLMAAVPNVNGMYALRFFIGAFEASSYPGIVAVLCNWYTPRELATRISLFSTSYPAASMFVSSMQVAIQSTLDGRSGLPGWKWLFIFNAIMTVVVASFGFFMVPDQPGSGKVFWLNEEDDRYLRERMDRCNKQPPVAMSWQSAKETLRSSLFYIFTLASLFWNFAQDSTYWFILFLKAETNANGTKRFNVQEINAIPIGASALQLVTMMIFAWLSSRTGWRATWLVAQLIPTLVGIVILCVWPPSFAAKMVGFFLLFTSNGGAPILIAWMADWCPSAEKRNIMIGVSASLTFAIDAFQLILIYPASEAPNYRVGYKAALAYGLVALLMIGVFKYFDTRWSRKAPVQPDEPLSVDDGDVDDKY